MILHGNNKKFICLDWETESLNLHYSRGWQLGFAICDCKEVLETYNYYLDIPDLHIPEHVKKMTHFDEGIYNREKRPPSEVMEKLNRYLNDPDYYVIGQNILGFDVYITATMQRYCGMPVNYDYMSRTLDTRTLALLWKTGTKKPSSMKEYIFTQYKLLHDKSNRRTSVSLANLTKELGVPYDADRHHDASADIIMTFEVFKKLAKLLNL